VKYIKIFLMLSILISCGDKTTSEPTPNKKLSQIFESPEGKEIFEVSRIAGTIFFDMSVFKELNCIDKDAWQNGEGLKNLKNKDKAEEIVNSIFQSFSNKCVLFSSAIKDTEPVYKIIRTERRMPENLYIFSIYLPHYEKNDDLYVEHQIGLFPDIDSCTSVEALARDYEIPSTKCKKWSNVF